MIRLDDEEDEEGTTAGRWRPTWFVVYACTIDRARCIYGFESRELRTPHDHIKASVGRALSAIRSAMPSFDTAANIVRSGRYYPASIQYP